ncbi:MAG: hypothetical protein GX945_06540 [Lentisphaerae bacterium]|nr:hypothetical protein [Lentisphaerota bacterium]
MRIFLATLFIAVACCADIQFSNDAYSLSLRESDGAILTIVDKIDNTTVTGGNSLWQLNFEKDSLETNAFMAAPWHGKMQSRWNDSRDRLTLQYQSEALALNIHFAFAAKHFDLSAELVRCDRPVLRITVPAHINFPTGGMLKVVFPQRGAETMGYAFLPAFYGDHRKSDNQTFIRTNSGPKGYEQLFGGPLNQLGDNQPMAPLSLTEAGREWYPAETLSNVLGKKMTVNRPSAAGQHTLSLLENANGPALCAYDFGGKGLLFRIGGSNAEGDDQGRDIFTAMMTATMQGYVRRNPDALRDKKIAVIALRNGPAKGGWTPVAVDEWQRAITKSSFWRIAGAQLTTIENVTQMRAAMTSDDFGMILNPYGEWFPSHSAEELTADLELLRAYVKRGGLWWETGGYPFYYFLEPKPYLSFSTQYPSGVADFIFVDYQRSGIALFGVQPMMRKPWDRERVAVPCSLSTWGDPAGAAISHGWNDAIEPGMTWRSPLYRCQFGFTTPQPAIDEYARVNEIAGSLEAKVRNPELLEKLKNAVLVRMGGTTAGIQIQTMADIPAPNIIHFTEYLHGGFDKQYPDHLPPRASWGTAEDLTRFYRAGHELGHLMMPYTNTSWWCIDPKGPTFEREGEAPLAFNREGKLNREQYARNVGYGLCFWHPAVQAIHREVRHDMSVTYPSDIILQDQVGARAWRWNYHALEPRKASAMDGMHALSMEDAEHVPLATEDGHDRVVNFETMLCGCAWGTIPARGKHRTRHAKYLFPQDEWQFFPILSYLSHHQCLFTTHDLGHFIEDNDQLSYALAFGYSMSYRWDLGHAKNPSRKRWLYWLDAIQKTVAADYAGKKLLDFSYPRFQLGLEQPHQVTCTRFAGDIVVIANLENAPCELAPILAAIALPDSEKRWLEQHVLPPYGFYVSSPRAKAASLQNRDGQYVGFALAYKNQRLNGALRGRDRDNIAAILPAAWLAGVDEVLNENGRREKLTAHSDGAVTTLAWQAQAPAVLASLPKVAPAKTAATPRRVALLAIESAGNDDFRNTLKRWLDELPAQFTKSGLEVDAIRSIDELIVALQAPETKRPFAIVSPSGEFFYGKADMPANAMLDLIRKYVHTGGIWWQAGGGYPFYHYKAQQDDGSWKNTPLYHNGAISLGFSCEMFSVSDLPQPLALTDIGKQWLDPERAAIIIAANAGVQRPIRRGDSPLVLVKTLLDEDGYLEAVRCEGTGFFFHLGGFAPPWASTINSVGATIEYLYLNPWPDPMAGSGPEPMGRAGKATKIWRLAP